MATVFAPSTEAQVHLTEMVRRKMIIKPDGFQGPNRYNGLQWNSRLINKIPILATKAGTGFIRFKSTKSWDSHLNFRAECKGKAVLLK